MAIYQLVYGGKTLNLNDLTTYMLQEGFYPPAAGAQADLAYGLGLDRSGGNVVDEKALDRQWAFPILVRGDSITETGAAVQQLQSFLNLAQDAAGGYPNEKLYLEYHPSGAIPYRPVYGQGFYRYWIKWGKVRLTSEYGALPFDKQIRAEVELVVGPYAYGQQQTLMRASGGMWEDALFNNQVRGTAICPATVNIFFNPLFQFDWYGAWNNTWSVEGDLAAWQNKNMREYILWGDTSCGVVRIGATNIRMYASVTAASTNNHTLSCYAKRLDGGTIDATVVKLYYNSLALTTTYQALENGWYRLYANVTGIASAIWAGIELQVVGVTLYVTGFQFEDTQGSSFPTPFCFGDMVGCKWDQVEAAHNSKSTRTVGNVSIFANQLLRRSVVDQMTLRMAWRWYYPSTHATDHYIFDCGALEIYYRASDDKIVMTDGTTTISTAAQTFAAGDLAVFHFVVGPGSMKIYKNGVEAATSSAFVLPWNVQPNVGSTVIPDKHLCATILDFTIWSEVATATQIANDYADVYQQVSSGDGSGQRVNPIPWYWSLVGVGKCDIYQDDTHADYVVAGGIAGNVPAHTVLEIYNSATGADFTINHNWADEEYSAREEFRDLNSSAKAGALSGEVQDFSVNTTEVLVPDPDTIDLTRRRIVYRGKTIYAYASLADAGSNLTVRLKAYYSTSYIVAGDYKPVVADTSLRRFLIGPLVLPNIPDEDYPHSGYDTIGYLSNIKIYLGCIRTVAGAANVRLDFYRLLAGVTLYVPISSGRLIFVDSERGVMATDSTPPPARVTEQPAAQGAYPELRPGQYNYLTVLHGDVGSAVTLTENAVVYQIFYTPRWMIL